MKNFRIYDLVSEKYLDTQKYRYLSTFAVQSGQFIFESNVDFRDSNNSILYANDVIMCRIKDKVFHLWITIPKHEVVIGMLPSRKLLGNLDLLAHLCFDDKIEVKKITEIHYYNQKNTLTRDEFWECLNISEALKECYTEYYRD